MFRPDSEPKPGPEPVVDRKAETKPETKLEWAVGSARALGVQETMVATSAPARDPIGELVGSYRIRSLLGKGGCGSVWLGEHEVISSKVAIKILRSDVINIPGVQERFITEARAASTIPSHHLPRYIDLGQLPTGEPYAIMEYLEGCTVHDRIKQRGHLPLADALTIARQAAETLALAHEASIIHRDIKPENIFLVGSGPPDIKLLDFGVAKLVGDAMQASTLQTAAGSFVGTPAYCAPEQLLGAVTTAAVDMYALGTTLYEMLAGSLPFDITSPEFLVSKISDPPPRVCEKRADVPERLDALVAAMLAANPTERPASMRVLVDELDRIHEPAATPRKHKRRWPLAVAAMVAVTVAIVTAVVVTGGNSKRHTPAAAAPVAAPEELRAPIPTAGPAPAAPVPAPAAVAVPTASARPAAVPAAATPAPSSGKAPAAPVRRPTGTQPKRPPADNPDVIMADPFQ